MIITHEIRDIWHAEIDGKRYYVERRRTRNGESWQVESAIRNYDGEIASLRWCSDEGRTHKRVVAWMKEQVQS